MARKSGSSRNKPRNPSGGGGDVISIHHTGDNSVVAAGRGANASMTNIANESNSLTEWQDRMNKAIDANSSLSPADKIDTREQIEKITTEAAKGKQADPSRLEKLVNTLGVMAPDIFEVALTTIGNPLAGLGLVAKKIGEKAKIEVKS
jgi:hypothetical protein